MQKKIHYLMIPILFYLITACNNNVGNNKLNPYFSHINSVTVGVNDQIRTPSSSQTLFDDSKVIPSSSMVSSNNQLGVVSSCFRLVPEPDGKNFTTKINSSPYWSKVEIEFHLQNTCQSPQQMSDLDLHLTKVLINHSKSLLQSFGLEIQQSGSPYLSITNKISQGQSPGTPDAILSISTPSCAGQWCDWAKIKPNQIITLKAVASYGQAIDNLQVGDVSIEGPPAPHKPINKVGELNLNILVAQSTKLACDNNPGGCKFEVDVISPANETVEKVTVNTVEGASKQVKIKNLAPGEYNVKVLPTPTINSTTVTYQQTPATNISIIAGSNSQVANVIFNYTPSVNPNSLVIDLPENLIPSEFQNSTVMARIVDDTGSTIDSFSFDNSTSSKTIKSHALITGKEYTLQLQNLADPMGDSGNGLYYKSASKNITIAAGETKVTANNYDKVSDLTNYHTAILNVNKLESGQIQTISYGVNSSSDWYTYFKTDSLSLGANKIVLPPLPVTITPSAINNINTSVAPTNTVDSNDMNINIINTANSASKLHAFVDSMATMPADKLTINTVVDQNNQQVLFIENMGTVSADLGELEINSIDTGFTKQLDECSNHTLLSGETCAVVVRYTASSVVSNSSAKLKINDLDISITGNANISGSKQMAQYYCGGKNCGQSSTNDVNPATKLVILAFMGVDSDGNAIADTWNSSLVTQWQAGGAKVFPSLGGEYMSWSAVFASPKNMNNFVNSTIKIIEANNFDGVDLDLENNATVTPQQVADISNMLRAKMDQSSSSHLNNGHGIISIAPQVIGVTPGVEVVAPSATSYVSANNLFVNMINYGINALSYVFVQVYNNWYYQSSDLTKMLEAGYQGWANNPTQWWSGIIPDYVGVPQDKLIIGVPASNSAASSHIASPTNVVDAINALKALSTDPHGIMMWDSHWDKQNNCAMSSAVATAFNLPGNQCPA